MNRYLPIRFDEHITRLALGIEALDGPRQQRIPHPIQITFDDLPRGAKRPSVVRHDSCLFVLLYAPGVGARVELRLFDSSELLWAASVDRRRFVPRRLRIPVLDEGVVDGRPYTERVRRPVLFPGAAYDVSESTTGLRGRVENGGQPVRWARVQAIDPISAATVGLAHCDDRGEFLLLIQPGAAPPGDLTDPLPLQLRVWTPKSPAVPVAAAVKAVDGLWDLPIEEAPAAGDPDPVLAGDPPWDNWDAGPGLTPVSFPLGRLMRQQPALVV
jgi:hypothetical protein